MANWKVVDADDLDGKLAAIANKIRNLLGVTRKMGIDSMPNELSTIQTDVQNAYSAIAEKGGAVDGQNLTGGLTSAIRSIPDGVIVQRAEGTVKLKEFSFNINCGFRPDLIYFEFGTRRLSFGDNPNYFHKDCNLSTAIAFNEEKRSGDATVIGTYSFDDKDVMVFVGSRTDTGATFTYQLKTATGTDVSFLRTPSVRYVAVKYT